MVCWIEPATVMIHLPPIEEMEPPRGLTYNFLFFPLDYALERSIAVPRDATGKVPGRRPGQQWRG